MRAGDTLGPVSYPVTREGLVAYAAASGDHNPIHQDEAVALAVGLPGVIAHGMYTMALAARALDEWAGGPGRIRELGVKFTKPVVVSSEGTEISVSGVVGAVEDGAASVRLEVTCGGERVLGAATAVLHV